VAHQRLKFSSISLVAANLVPLAGVVLWQWSISSIIVLYWFENVVIGVINVARMIAFSPAGASLAAAVGAPSAPAAAMSQALGRIEGRALAHGIKLFIVPFFVIHYFMFCAVHGVFVFSMFPDEVGYFPETNGFELIGTLMRAIEIFQTPLAFAAAILASSHVISFFVNYLGGGEYKRLDLQRLLTMPYGRIVVLHLTIIFGGMASMALGERIWALVILILVKIGVDLKLHLKEHLKAA
jgi:Family of unknown function (DUF6498)